MGNQFPHSVGFAGHPPLRAPERGRACPGLDPGSGRELRLPQELQTNFILLPIDKPWRRRYFSNHPGSLRRLPEVCQKAERGAAALRAEAYNLALGATSGTDPAGTTTRKRDGSDARSSA